MKHTRHFILAALTFGYLLLGQTSAWAEGQFIDIQPKTEADIQLVLDTLEASIAEPSDDLPPIVLMLHGDEADHFLRSNYSANKDLIDQTAKLAAYDVIKVQICKMWMQNNKYESDELFPFVEPVAFGAGELERLAGQEGYTEYSVSL